MYGVRRTGGAMGGGEGWRRRRGEGRNQLAGGRSREQVSIKQNFLSSLLSFPCFLGSLESKRTSEWVSEESQAFHTQARTV